MPTSFVDVRYAVGINVIRLEKFAIFRHNRWESVATAHATEHREKLYSSSCATCEIAISIRMAKMKAEEILIEHKCSFMPNQCSIVFSVLTVNEYEFKF